MSQNNHENTILTTKSFYKKKGPTRNIEINLKNKKLQQHRKKEIIHSISCPKCHCALMHTSYGKRCPKCKIEIHKPKPKFCRECHGKLKSSPEGKVCSTCGFVASRKRKDSFKQYPNRKPLKNAHKKDYNVYVNEKAQRIPYEKLTVPVIKSKHFNLEEGNWNRIES